MVWALFLNNQTVRQTALLPSGKPGVNPRYIFIEGRDVPIIFTDAGHTGNVPQYWAVSINDGKNPVFQIGYEGEGKVQVTLLQENDVLRYTVETAHFNNLVTKDL